MHMQPIIMTRLPAYVVIPRGLPGTGAGYLGVAHKAFETGVDPARPGPFRVPNFALPSGVTLEQVGALCDPPTTAQTIGRLETGTRTVSVKWLNRIALALGVTSAELVALPGQSEITVASSNATASAASEICSASMSASSARATLSLVRFRSSRSAGISAPSATRSSGAMVF